jgi:hypothetical protein
VQISADAAKRTCWQHLGFVTWVASDGFNFAPARRTSCSSQQGKILEGKKVRYNKALPTILLPVLLGSATPAAANDHWFAGLGLTDSRFRVDGSKFRNYALSGQAGRWLWPGVGLQLSAALPLDDDTSGDVKVKVESVATIGLKFEGSTKKNNGVAAAMTFGGAITNIDASSALSSLDSNYSGIFLTGSLTYAIDSASQMLLEYSTYKFDSTVSMSHLTMSYRINF